MPRQRIAQLVQRGINGALDVEAAVRPEILVLNGHKGVHQIIADVTVFYPHAVFLRGVKPLVFLPHRLALFVHVLIHHHAGVAQLQFFQVQKLAVVLCGVHHIQAEQHAGHADGHDAKAHHHGHKAQKAEQHALAPAFRFRLRAPCARRRAGRARRGVVFLCHRFASQYPAAVRRRFVV